MKWALGVGHAIMPMGEVRADGWCPKCLTSSLWRSAFAVYERNRPTGMVQTLKYCVDCGWSDV